MRSARCLHVVAVLVLCCTPVARAQIVFGPPVVAASNVQSDYDGAVADLDGDGFIDLALTAAPEHQAQLFFGDGRGHFGPPQPTLPVIDATAIGLGDLDGDGHPELITAPYVPGEPIVLRVWKGLGGAAFSGPVTYPVGGQSPSWNSVFLITTDDADGDSDLDVVVRVTKTVIPDFNGALTVLLNDGSGNLTPQVVVSGTQVINGEVADLDADGLLDAVYTTLDDVFYGVFTMHLSLGQPGGGFVESHTWTSSFLLALTDLNQDGLLDLVTRIDDEGTIVLVQLGLGGAAFAPQQPFSVGFGPATACADFDGDAVPDLLFQPYDGVSAASWAVWPGDGHGGFDAAKVSYTDLPGSELLGGATHEFMFAADAVADGRLDILDGRPVDFGLEIDTIPNWTYPAGAAQLDLGHAQFGGLGWPGTLVTGDFVPDEKVTVALWGAGVDKPAYLVAGLSEAFAPFKGGVLVPVPDLVIGPLSTGTEQTFELEGRWPHGLPVGTALTLQWWMIDASAPQGMSASTAVRITQP